MKRPSLLDRLRTKKAARPEVVLGVVWYTEYEWALVKASAEDPELFENSYAEWLCIAAKPKPSPRMHLAWSWRARALSSPQRDIGSRHDAPGGGVPRLPQGSWPMALVSASGFVGGRDQGDGALDSADVPRHLA